MAFCLGGWLTQGSNKVRKDIVEFLGDSCFLRTSYVLSAFKGSTGSNGKCDISVLLPPMVTQCEM